MEFLSFGKIWPILTLDMVKYWEYWNFSKTKNDYLIKANDSYIIVKVKIFHFWPCPKSKWALSCQIRANFFEYSIVSDNPPENWWNITKKMLGANRLIFAMDPKVQLEAESFFQHSGPKFLSWFCSTFYKFFLM